MLRQIFRVTATTTRPAHQCTATTRCISDYSSKLKSQAEPPLDSKDESLKASAKTAEESTPKKKTQAELDQELQLKLQGLAGDGGDAGVEYEDGKPVSMKRSVKNNMFRYI